MITTLAKMADVVWVQAATCAGNSVSILNADQPDIIQMVTELGANIASHGTLDPKTGREFMQGLDLYLNGQRKLDVLAVEGAIPRGPDGTGMYCIVGGRPVKDIVKDLAKVAAYTVAVGTCAAFGGVVAANPNPTDATGLQFHKDKIGGFLGKDYVSKAGLPVINTPGCPAHPDWSSKTLAAVLLGKAKYIELDAYNRPKLFYGELVHWACPHNEFFEYKVSREDFGCKGCLFLHLGCKGPLTHADCNTRLWNRQSSKTRVGSPCLGCTEPNFPDEHSGHYFTTPETLGVPTKLPLDVSRGAYLALSGAAKAAAPARLKEEKTKW